MFGRISGKMELLKALPPNIGKFIDSTTTAYHLYILTDKGLFMYSEDGTFSKILIEFQTKAIFLREHELICQLI
jgi:hypothetical protein